MSSVEASGSGYHFTGFALTDRVLVHRLADVLGITLLVPVLFLMAVVVFYGCLLAVLTHRLGWQSVTRRRGLEVTVVEPDRPGPVAARSPVSTDHTIVRFLIIVSRLQPDRYEELRRIFGGQGNTDVIFDRRRPDPDVRRASPWPMRRNVDRRQRHVDEDLRVTGWAMLRLNG